MMKTQKFVLYSLIGASIAGAVAGGDTVHTIAQPMITLLASGSGMTLEPMNVSTTHLQALTPEETIQGERPPAINIPALPPGSGRRVKAARREMFPAASSSGAKPSTMPLPGLIPRPQIRSQSATTKGEARW